MNSVNPTGVLTAMGKKGFAANPEKQALLVNRIPLGRIAGNNLVCLHVLYCSIYWSDTSLVLSLCTQMVLLSGLNLG